MCSIAGILSTQNIINKACDFRDLINHMSLRGPDNQGSFIDQNLLMAHGRLAIQDPTQRSNQPLISNNSILIYNGEIYNKNYLRKKYSYPNDIISSDTLVLKWLLDNFEIKEFITDINGMFAFAYFNRASNQLILCRDRFGMKPLFYSFLNDTVIFATDYNSIRILYKILYGRKLHFNLQSCYQFIDYGFISKDNSLFTEIKNLVPGTYIQFAVFNEQLTIKQKIYYSFSNITNYNTRYSFNETDFIDLLNSSIESHLSGDVPMSLAYSYGLDSSYIYSRIKEDNKVNELVNLRYTDTSNKFESEAIIEEDYNNKSLFTLNFNSNSLLKEFIYLSNNFLPLSDPATLLTSYLSRSLKLLGRKVMLTGDGGDELMLGYQRHFLFKTKLPTKIISPFSKILNLISPNINFLERPDKLLKMLVYFENKPTIIFQQDSLSHSSIVKHLVQSTGKEYKETYNENKINYKNINNKLILQQLEYMYMIPSVFCTKNDIGSSYHGIETRHPFLSNDMVDYLIKSDIHSSFNNINRRDIIGKYLSTSGHKIKVESKKVGMFPDFSIFFNDKKFQDFSNQLIFESYNNSNLPFSYSLNEIIGILYRSSNPRPAFRFLSILTLAQYL